MQYIAILPQMLKIKEVRQQKGYTLDDLSKESGVSKRMISAYEAGTNDITLTKLRHIATALKVNIWELVEVDSKTAPNIAPNIAPNPELAAEPSSKYVGVPQVVTVDSLGNENIPFVRSKAAAGYVGSFMQPEYVSNLPTYRLPGLDNATYRMFEVSGHSMRPTLAEKDLVIGQFVEDIRTIREDRVYIIVTNDDLLIKRCLNRLNKEGKLICKSDNSAQGYKDIVLDQTEIKEAWYACKRITDQLPGPEDIYSRISNIEAKLAIIESNKLSDGN